jgi:hypothetical protein
MRTRLGAIYQKMLEVMDAMEAARREELSAVGRKK